jgi:large conductance mechanosensitive channel
MLKGFRDFILRGNVIDLAVAVVVGGAFNAIVNSLVKDIITPFIAAIGGKKDFSALYFTINNSRFLIGDFVNAIISFVIIAAVIYFFIVAPMNRILAKIKKGEKVDPTEKQCPFCLSQIPIKATKCKFCTSSVKSEK